MKNIHSVITREQAIIRFEENFMPYVRIEEKRYNNHPDLPMRRETWNNYTDGLCKDGEISDWQYENWSQPPVCEGD